MKRTLQAIISACILCGSVLAIPQNFNGGFFRAAGQPFEDFAIAALGPGAELKGKWIAVAKQEGKLRLAVDAVVFGIPASEVVVEKSGGGVAKYTVTYKAADDRKRGRAAASLKDRVLGAVRAYTGTSMESGRPADYKNARISVAESKEDVTLEITKAP